jgi:hypothetical protein
MRFSSCCSASAPDTAINSSSSTDKVAPLSRERLENKWTSLFLAAVNG